MIIQRMFYGYGKQVYNPSQPLVQGCTTLLQMLVFDPDGVVCL